MIALTALLAGAPINPRRRRCSASRGSGAGRVAPPPAPGARNLARTGEGAGAKLALEAVDRLQNGDEPAAKQLLATAQGLDPSNDIARKMTEQINADPQKDWAVFFRYTVQRDDSLSKLAQQYMGDRFRFCILAKYNHMPSPSKLAAGQVIKIPGRAPAATSAGTSTSGADEPWKRRHLHRRRLSSAAPPSASTRRCCKRQRLEASGDLQGAGTAFNDAVALAPSNRDGIVQRDAAKAALIRSYDREATQAFQRQNLDLAITRWDRLLELDPSNQKAKLERERAIELKKKMAEKFGTTTN